MWNNICFMILDPSGKIQLNWTFRLAQDEDHDHYTVICIYPTPTDWMWHMVIF